MNNNTLYIFKSKTISSQLQNMIENAIGLNPYEEIYYIQDISDLNNLQNQKILIAVDLDSAGYCLPIFSIISYMFASNKRLSDCIGAMVIYSPSELNTKSTATDIIYKFNQLGCSFIGHPIVEATASLANFKTWQKTVNKSLINICNDMCKKLGERLYKYAKNTIKKPKILALHSSHNKTSNTLALWHLIKKHLYSCEVEELHVENGKVLDCKGCSFKTCTYFSSQNSCFYGGMMVEEIFPSIEKADGIVWICPNYNDSISANLTAVINRLTALYRKTSFLEKSLFSVIVSGNSGSDSVARQLIDSLCFNKGFILPPGFCIMETANDPNAILYINDIDFKAKKFAINLLSFYNKIY